jgi:hypothetical protein
MQWPTMADLRQCAVRQRTRWSKLFTCPLASHTFGCMVIAASGNHIVSEVNVITPRVANVVLNALPADHSHAEPNRRKSRSIEI